MEKKDVPQDRPYIYELRGVFYAVDESGQYVQAISSGRDPVTNAHEQAIEELEERLAVTLERVKKGEISPIAYYMEKCIMDVRMLSEYVGIARWRVKRHMDPAVFRRLSPDVLGRYAEIFQITVEQLVDYGNG